MVSTDRKAILGAIGVLAKLVADSEGETVEVPAADYHRLLECERRLHQQAALPRQRCPRSRIDQDEDVAHFIAERAGKMMLREIVDECRRIFGNARTPSRSAVHRFIHRLNI